MSRSALIVLAVLGSLSVVAAPAVACEMHKQHSTSISQAPAVAPPSSLPEEQASTSILVSPAAAAMSVSEALGSEPYEMRCPRMRGTKEALTQ
ncbi:MAG TPA: hypothetical protein VH933_17640 [Aestuariivirgaceae bacterium]|jgi:hypothetical protein